MWERAGEAFRFVVGMGLISKGRGSGDGNELFAGSALRPVSRRSDSIVGSDIREAIYQAVAVDKPMTVRQVFYRLVSQGVIEKSEKEYKGRVCRLLTEMRLSGTIPFGWIADNTRWMRKPITYSSVKQAFRRTVEHYRRALWDNQDVYVEVWLEKDALAGVLSPVTFEWDVPLMVARGFSSLSYLYEAAEAIQAQGKPAYLYYLGDRDPSGVHIDRNIEKRLRQFAPEAEIHFKRIAVIEAQIEELGLPTRPTKTSDSRSKSFKGESVELDAIPPVVLRDLVAGCIIQHVDQRRQKQMREEEEIERSVLAKQAEQFGSSTEGDQ
jgi:hypothetical protein